MSRGEQLLIWGVFVIVCVGLVPLLGGAMLRLACRVTGVPGVRFGRCWLAYLAAYVVASAVGIPLLLVLPREHGVPAPPTVVAWLLVALAVHALIVPRVLGTPLRRTLVAHVVALVLTGVLIAALALPAVLVLKREARRVARVQQLVEIGRAAGHFTQQSEGEQYLMPAAIYAPDGRALLSWRVALLPYMDRQDLYEQFRLDEPWDSPHNLPLAARMPGVYGEGDAGLDEAGQTRLRVVVSPPHQHPRTPFVLGDARGAKLAAFQDGMARTALVLEMAEPVAWTNPDEPRYVPGGPLPAFGRPGGGGRVHVLMADGSVSVLRADIPASAWEALLTCNGNEPDQPH
jgi:prepilin-type processing-associated H-X9-DG protein